MKEGLLPCVCLLMRRCTRSNGFARRMITRPHAFVAHMLYAAAVITQNGRPYLCVVAAYFCCTFAVRCNHTKTAARTCVLWPHAFAAHMLYGAVITQKRLPVPVCCDAQGRGHTRWQVVPAEVQSLPVCVCLCLVFGRLMSGYVVPLQRPRIPAECREGSACTRFGSQGRPKRGRG